MIRRLVSFLALGVLACSPAETPPENDDTPPGQTSEATPDADVRFVDVSREAGLDFVHANGMSGERYFVEPVGAGCALADLDGDGDLDAVLVQGAPLPPAGADASPAPRGSGTRIFRNDLEPGEDGRLRPRFRDVTEESGLRAFGYGMGVATGDFDDDGRVDLYLTNFGPNQLWRNVGADVGDAGGGRIAFENVTAAAGDGVGDPRWSTSAAFADVDADGRLDLFFTNYVDFRLERHRPCRSAGGRPDYCGPQAYDGQTDRLLWNRGDGTFADVSGPAGLLDEASSGLGVVAADFDRDGHLDLYVANDLERNHLWRNLGPGDDPGTDDGVPRFENVALERGAAVSMLGRAQASMGVVAGDLDGDGDDDLFMTHLTSETHTLYVNDGHGYFLDRTATSGLGVPSLQATGFGTALLDFDHDGRLDLATANGAVKVIEAQVLAGDPYPLKQPNQLFRNLGGGRFAEVGETAGDAFGRLEVSRGIAVGDVDQDGHADVLLTNNQGPARLLRAVPAADDGAWIGLRVLTRDGGRDALGAHVHVVRADGSVLRRRVATDGSYLSAGDPRVLVGLGSDPRIAEIRVDWLGGHREVWRGLAPGRYHTLVAGQGEPTPLSRDARQPVAHSDTESP